MLFLQEMARLISSKELLAIPSIEQVIKAGVTLGLETYIVGGYVRDYELYRPSKDIDFVCLGSGIALAEEVAKKIKR